MRRYERAATNVVETYVAGDIRVEINQCVESHRWRSRAKAP